MIKKSYAKLNLFLEVVSKRDDGYHNLETIFHEIDFYDVIKIKVLKSNKPQITINCNNPSILPEKNLAYKAALLFFKKFSITDSILIDLEKKIPCGAGLGGGSSNAACVLNMLAEIYSKQDKKKDLLEMALQLGADVPFFLTGGTAIGKGIGEKLEFINLKQKFYFLLFCPDIHISTQKVYESLKLDLTNQWDYNIFLDTLFNKKEELINKIFFNRLEQVSFSLCPQLGVIKKNIEQITNKKWLMTGSGSALFCMFLKQDNAVSAFNILDKNGYHSLAVSSRS